MVKCKLAYHWSFVLYDQCILLPIYLLIIPWNPFFQIIVQIFQPRSIETLKQTIFFVISPFIEA